MLCKNNNTCDVQIELTDNINYYHILGCPCHHCLGEGKTYRNSTLFQEGNILRLIYKTFILQFIFKMAFITTNYTQTSTFARTDMNSWLKKWF